MTEKQLRIRQQEMRQNAYGVALRISEAYPNVKLVTICYQGRSMSSDGKRTSGKQTYTPDMLDVFLVDCPNSSCTGIGFDMGSIISDMVRKHEKEKHDELECNEFEDAERYGDNRCKAHLDYTIQIEYRS